MSRSVTGFSVQPARNLLPLTGRDCTTAIFLAIVLVSSSLSAFAQKENPRLTQRIDEARRITLSGNTRPEANAANDRGAVAGQFPLEHMQLQLQRSPEQEKALEQFIAQLHDRNSPNFHQWLKAEEFGASYGLASADVSTITGWLESHGFVVNLVYASRMVVDFSGTAAQVREAFHTEIHHLEVNGKGHIANMSDPQIPAALAPAVTGIFSLHDFRPRPLHRSRVGYTTASGNYLLVPADLATIYNFNPMFAAGYSGQGQTIVVVEDGNVYNPNDWTTFRNTFGLTAAYPQGSFTQVHPASSGANNCSNPGVINGVDGEATLDVEWSSAAAPSAAIELASCADSQTTTGFFIALQNLLNASGTPPAIVSVSYGDSESDIGAAANAAVSSMYQQAVAEGVSVFVASGDQLADVTDYGASYASHGINVNGWGSTPYNVSVGGTDFGDTYAGTNSTYWNATNLTNDGSALSYIPEIPWNSSCASVLLATHHGFSTTYGSNGFCNSALGEKDFLVLGGGSGGPSACATGSPSTKGIVGGTCAGYPKPAWQSVFGNPNDGVRDLPDVSLFAANGSWGHYYAYCDTNPQGGASCNGTPDTWSGAGGTSFASPIMAGVQALINQYTGSRWGNPNPTYYSLANAEYGASGSTSCNSSNGNQIGSNCIFYDVTQGDNDGPCTGTHNCYLPSGTYGVLSTSNASYQPAYGTAPGWDFATGIGTINVYNLVKAFPAPTPVLQVSATSLNFGAMLGGANPASQSFTLLNYGGGTMSWTATKTQSWLTLSSASGSAPSTITVSVSTSGLAAGGYSDTITITASGAQGSPQTIPVSLTVAVPAPIVATLPAAGALGTTTWMVNGAVNPNGYATTYWFEYDTTPMLTKLSQTSPQNLAAGTKENLVSAGLTGLSPHLAYHYRVVAKNSYGTTRGQILELKRSTVATLTVSTPGNGTGTVTPSPVGSICGPGCYTYPLGTAVTLTAAPATGSVFGGWGGACSGTGSCSVTMNSSQSVTATFLSIFNLTISTTGTGTVTRNPVGSSCGTNCYSYTSGTAVTLTATPSSGYVFGSWGGACSGTGSCIVTMSSAQSVTATFNMITYTLTVSKSGAGTGTVTSSSGGINCGTTCSAAYNSGTVVTLTATAGTGSIFGGWSGGGCGGTGTCPVTMNSIQSVTASFLPAYTMNWNVQNDGTCSSRSSTGYIYYRLFDLTASPKLYYPCTNGTGAQTGCTSTTWNWIVSTTSTQVSSVSIICIPGHWIAFGADIDDSDSKGYWGYGINGTQSCTSGAICGAYCAATTVTLPTLTCQ